MLHVAVVADLTVVVADLTDTSLPAGDLCVSPFCPLQLRKFLEISAGLQAGLAIARGSDRALVMAPMAALGCSSPTGPMAAGGAAKGGGRGFGAAAGPVTLSAGPPPTSSSRLGRPRRSHPSTSAPSAAMASTAKMGRRGFSSLGLGCCLPLSLLLAPPGARASTVTSAGFFGKFLNPEFKQARDFVQRGMRKFLDGDVAGRSAADERFTPTHTPLLPSLSSSSRLSCPSRRRGAGASSSFFMASVRLSQSADFAAAAAVVALFVVRSVADFDEAIALDAAYKGRLWQRGLSLYYTRDFEAAAEQFRADVALNPNDTEEALWTYAPCPLNSPNPLSAPSLPPPSLIRSET